MANHAQPISTSAPKKDPDIKFMILVKSNPDIEARSAGMSDSQMREFCQDRFHSGKVVEHIPLFDIASLMQQLKGESPGDAG